MTIRVWSAPGSAQLIANSGRLLVLPPGTHPDTSEQAHALLQDADAIQRLLTAPDSAPLILIDAAHTPPRIGLRGQAEITVLHADGTTSPVSDPEAGESTRSRPAHTETLDAIGVHLDLGSTAACSTMLIDGITGSARATVLLNPPAPEGLSPEAQKQIDQWRRGTPSAASAPSRASSSPPSARAARPPRSSDSVAHGAADQRRSGSRIADAFIRAQRVRADRAHSEEGC